MAALYWHMGLPVQQCPISYRSDTGGDYLMHLTSVQQWNNSEINPILR